MLRGQYEGLMVEMETRVKEREREIERRHNEVKEQQDLIYNKM